MKRLLPILIFIALHTAYADDTSRIRWEQKLPLLTNGMTRAQVEAIFPVYTNETPRSIAGGGSYTLSYALDANTEISLCYSEYDTPDRTGKQVLVGQNQSNRLFMVIGLHDRMVFDEEHNK